MTDWKDNKGSGPWDFTEQSNKWGYLNNPRWSNRQDSIDFCEGLGLETGSSSEHAPCGHWHKAKYIPITGGKWVAAMQQPGTPYIYVYDIEAKAVIRINTSVIPVIVDGIVRLNSIYALDYDMGWGNPGAQRGGYCMNKNGTRVWYLFTESTGNRSDAELVEVDITSYYMKKIRSTIFPNLVPSEPSPSAVNEQINDGCSDNEYTYWPTTLIAGRIIKIRNSDHVIVDDHTFNYPIEGCGAGTFDGSIATIDINKNTEKLYWSYCRDHSFCIPSYNACQHIIRADINLIADVDNVFCETGLWSPAYQNMIRLYGNHILHHRTYHPSFSGFISKRFLTDCTMLGDKVIGTDTSTYTCIRDHIAAPVNRPITGGLWSTYWVHTGSGGNVWVLGEDYSGYSLQQEYLQNILGMKDDKLFTLMYVNNIDHPAHLYCIDFSDMSEISNLDVSFYAGQIYPLGGYPWDWTSVSAMNEQTGRILIFRYNNYDKRNYAVCFEAIPSFNFLCDVRFERIHDDPTSGPFGEPVSWPFEGFTVPPIPSTDPPIEVISDPGPGEIIYDPPPIPDGAPDNVPVLQSGFIDYMDIGPGQTLFFKIVASVSDCAYPIQVSNTPQSQEPHTVHLLIKRGSKPTIADFERTWEMNPLLSGTDNLYWKYNTGSQAEFVEITELMGFTTFYIMLYNNGTKSVRNQRLIVKYYG